MKHKNANKTTALTASETLSDHVCVLVEELKTVMAISRFLNSFGKTFSIISSYPNLILQHSLFSNVGRKANSFCSNKERLKTPKLLFIILNFTYF